MRIQMKQENHALEQLWERGVERASEDETRQQPLDAETINHAAGLSVKAGLRAGLWGATKECTQSCSCHGTCTC